MSRQASSQTDDDIEVGRGERGVQMGVTYEC